MPGKPRQIEILDPLAVHVDIEVPSEPRGPFGNPPLGAMAFVDERGNNSEDGLGRGHLMLERDPHRFTPPLVNVAGCPTAVPIVRNIRRFVPLSFSLPKSVAVSQSLA